MNINLKKFSLTILAALTLTACGSGSGASASNAPTAQPSALAAQPSTPAAQPSTPATQPSEQAVLEMPKRSPTNTGLVFSIKIESEEDSVGQINTINNEQELSNRTLTSIDVDGKQIPIAFTENWNEAKYIEQPLNGVPHICCNKYTAMRFGAIASNEAGQNDILFYNGIPTEKLPDSGEVTYEGESIMTSKESVIPDDYMKGSSKFIVNFGDKKLSGSLIIDTTKSTSSSQKVKIDIEKAKITGNTFSGTAQSDSFKSQGIAEGKFYGDGAKELGGMVKAKDNSWAGAYGAKAQ
ncbi:TPA: Slam-dependent surface lipoprotein [Haemophilus influenzae]|uniref:Slam-dependent surface lipoprotein n=1 Tax=Haemophilus influenzae TaxID=727 RepID=UPI001F2A04CB|nr:Slam-dependent surface lipoprotein [Haemophilus influenzae]